MCCFYNRHKDNVSNHVSHLSKGLDNYIGRYENILFPRYFSSQSLKINYFCIVYNLSNLVKKPICLKNSDNQSCIGLFLIKMFSKYCDDENRDFRFSQNGNYGFENLLQEKNQKSFTTETIKISMAICLRKN